MLQSGNYDLILVIDQREASLQRGALFTLQTALAAHNIAYTMRMLPIGDFVWVCREKSQASPKEITLNYLIERKREDDLFSSIVDGRFNEQKSRIHRSGISNTIYVIEKYSQFSTWKLPALSSRIPSQKQLFSILASTQIHDKFLIQKTSSFEETVLFIISMTKWIQKLIAHKNVTTNSRNSIQSNLSSSTPLHLIDDVVIGISSFQSFSREHGRRSGLTLKDLYISQLCCIHSVSVEKAHAISGMYPTLQSLWQAFETTKNDPQNLLASISLPNGRKLGEKCSQLVYRAIH